MGRGAHFTMGVYGSPRDLILARKSLKLYCRSRFPSPHLLWPIRNYINKSHKLSRYCVRDWFTRMAVLTYLAFTLPLLSLATYTSPTPITDPPPYTTCPTTSGVETWSCYPTEVCSSLTRPCGGQCISIWTPPPVIPCPSTL